MATIDIRAEEALVDTIVFAEGCCIRLDPPYFTLTDKDEAFVEFLTSDIDNLIKALQKVKELTS